MAKDEKPSHVKAMEKANAQWEEADIIADTTEVDMGKAFHEALDVIRDDKGKIQYNRFNPEKFGDKYHHLVIDKYIGKLKSLITSKMGKEHKFSDAELGLAVEGMYGETKDHYLSLLAEHGSNFRISHYKATLGDHIEKLRGRLYKKAGDSLSSEQFSDIMKELLNAGKDKNGKAVGGKSDWIKTKDFSEFNKPLFRDDISALIRSYYNSNGNIGRDNFKKTTYISKYMANDPKQKYVHQQGK